MKQKHLNKAKELYQQLNLFHLQDKKWKNNYLAKWRRLAQKIDYTDNGRFLLMYCDIVEMRTGRKIQ